ncbi:murein biosynthesis integral membrane protein MurJ [Candidatus Oleimmundimicrobium sp.]|uniref:murein biosynthesis integral membrane protein MurJ n=1 Tax=Candidatus Oleimmundimicrobium sp. TaxID=3060597 RepID=UPI00271E961E|nr:murein biosynthesis integral membrane protein MurJ [Candidatus Oleimmundimicrobium sp.]MDO8885854.1 murein biosynthesis integral membrane protein MurJ [Candidatus Oleimmundimicrobium sp.]
MEFFEEVSAEEAVVSQTNLPENEKSTQKSFLAKATLIVMVATLGSRVFGFFREVVMAAYFGNGMAADAYRVAYAIPNLLLQLFGSAAIGSAFIPVITKYLIKKDNESIDIVASSVANFLFLIFTFFMIIGFIFAPHISKLMAPGFIADSAKFNLTVQMTRIMVPAIIFLGMSGFVMGMLHCYNHFTAPALAPIFFNILVIFSIVALTPKLGPISLAVGVTLGALVQLLFQIPFLRKKGWTYSFKLAWNHPGVKEIAALVIPIVFSLASIEINVFIDTRFTSILKAGSVAALHYALRVWSLPMGIFAIAISTVFFPMFSKQAALNDFSGLKKSFSLGLRLIFLIMVPASVGLMVLAKPIVKLLFERGAFGPDATAATVYALLFYTLGLTSASVLHFINRAFYSLKDTITPTIVAVIAITVNYFCDWALIGPLKHGGVALSTSFVMTFNFLCLLIIMRKRVGQMDGRKIMITFFKVCLASAALGVGAFFSWKLMASLMGEATIGQAVSVGTGIGVGVFIYLLIIKVLKLEEISIFTNLIRDKFKRGKNVR